MTLKLLKGPSLTRRSAASAVFGSAKIKWNVAWKGYQMNIETYWLNADYSQRLWVLREAGWRLQSGRPSRTAIVGARTDWGSLAVAIQNILTRRALDGQI
jgi:hypothetical protein